VDSSIPLKVRWKLMILNDKISSVGLDVFPNEPDVNPRLLEFPQVTLLPHMGTENQDTQRKMEVRALSNLRDFLLTGMGKDLVRECKEEQAKVKSRL
jgi:glyoxylate reductase